MAGERATHPAVTSRQEVYRLLAALAPGDVIPPEVYVADYADGSIPDWRIQSREAANGVVMLVAFDMSNTYAAGSLPASQGTTQFSLFGDGHVCYPAVRILSSQAKTLRCHPVEFNGEWPNTLCDMIQQATHIGGRRHRRSGGDGE